MATAYLDYAASTPLRPEAIEAARPFATEVFGNPSGMHRVAREAKSALEEAREQVAAALGAEPREIVFTGSGTEADNLAVKGAARAARDAGTGDHVVVSAIEHHGVLGAAERLEREGFSVTHARVTGGGLVDLDALAATLDERTVVVSVMLVNNEVGTIQPLDEVAALVRERAPRAVLHTDAVQGVPWLDVASASAKADLVAVSAHKFGGPKGVGALVVREGTRLVPLVDGGGQEAGRRSGTHNVAGVVGMAAALRATTAQRPDDVARVEALRDRLADGLAAAVPDMVANGDATRRVSGSLHIRFPGVESESLLLMLDRDGVYAAAGSSCQSGSMDPSHVLTAMGQSRDEALSAIRLSLGWPSTDADVDTALDVIPAAVERLRPLAARAR
jgi:cysteine desulfurase